MLARVWWQSHFCFLSIIKLFFLEKKFASNYDFDYESVVIGLFSSHNHTYTRHISTCCKRSAHPGLYAYYVARVDSIITQLRADALCLRFVENRILSGIWINTLDPAILHNLQGTRGGVPGVRFYDYYEKLMMKISTTSILDPSFRYISIQVI